MTYLGKEEMWYRAVREEGQESDVEVEGDLSNRCDRGDVFGGGIEEVNKDFLYCIGDRGEEEEGFFETTKLRLGSDALLVSQRRRVLTACLSGRGNMAWSFISQPFHFAWYLTPPDKPRYDRYQPCRSSKGSDPVCPSPGNNRIYSSSAIIWCWA